MVDPWRQFKSQLLASIEASGEGYSLDEVKSMVENGQAQAHYNGKCLVVTQIDSKPYGDVCIFWLVAGPLNELQAYENHIIKWAKDIGCYHALFIGRKGWVRALNKEWNEVGIIAKREL